jgi:hypothetical protein
MPNRNENLWLFCKKCGMKELVVEHTEFLNCQVCREPRYTVDDEGKPMIPWSVPQDPDRWM